MTGPVHLLGYENRDPIDITPNQPPHRNAFYGMGRGFYQATAEDGLIEVTAAGVLGDPAILETSPVHPVKYPLLSSVSPCGDLWNQQNSKAATRWMERIRARTPLCLQNRSASLTIHKSKQWFCGTLFRGCTYRSGSTGVTIPW